MSLYDDALGVTKQYMGPAAEKFMERQLKAMGLDSTRLSTDDLETLGDRCYTSGALYMADDKAQEFSKRIKMLA